MNVERILTPTADVFRNDYVLPQKPVIITDLLADQPIAQLRTPEQAATRLGDMQIVVQEEFTTFALRHSTLLDARSREIWSFKDYLAHIQTHPDTKQMSTEGNTPDEIRCLFELPACIRFTPEADDGDAWEDTASLLFLGNSGNYAHLHFDGDYRQVLLHQVFGTKRVILIPAIAARKLNPIRNFSSFFLEHFTETEKAEFVRYTGGYDCLLQPGETLFMPACIWHYLEYHDTALSFSIRFGRNPYTRFLGDKIHPNMYLQNIAAKLIDPQTAKQQYASVVQAIESAYYRPYSTPLEKGKALQRLLVELYHQLYPDVPQSIYALTNFAPLSDTLLQADSQRLYQTPAYFPSVPTMKLAEHGSA